MKKTIFILLYLFCLNFAFAQSSARPDGTINGIEKIEIAKGIYQFKASFDGYVGNCNSTIIINEKDILVFDTNTRPSTTRTILAEIKKITDKPVKFVVNSHWHPDHWSGNEVYAKEFPNVEIIATEETKQFMKDIAPSWKPIFDGILKRRQATLDNETKTGKRADGTNLTEEDKRNNEDSVNFYRSFVNESASLNRILPNRTFRDKLTLKHGGREFQLMSVYGDADHSTVLYLPKEKVLLTGDLLVYPIQWGANSYHLTPWLNSLKILSQLEVKTIIPGHGPAFKDKTYLNMVAELFEAVITQVKIAFGNGLLTIEEVQQAVNLDAIRLKFTKDDAGLNARFKRNTNDLIKMAYLEARDGMESKR